MQINTRKNAFEALFYLVWIIIKEQWKILIGILIFILILFPFPKIIALNGGYENGPNGIIGLIYTIPVLTITLICLPMVHNQISSSSIKKRLKASGVSTKIYSLVMILTFTLVSMALFYLSLSLTYFIFNNSTVSLDEGEFTSVKEIWFENKANWLAILLLAPISIFGLSSIGILIGRIKISEIIKGVLLFLIIIISILMSRTIFNPLNSDMVQIYDDAPPLSFEGVPIVQKGFGVLLAKIFIINPIGSMIFTMQHSMDSVVHKLVSLPSWTEDPAYAEIFSRTKVFVGSELTIIYSTIFSISILPIAVITS